jgi:hypothetical protein
MRFKNFSRHFPRDAYFPDRERRRVERLAKMKLLLGKNGATDVHFEAHDLVTGRTCASKGTTRKPDAFSANALHAIWRGALPKRISGVNLTE